MSPRSHTPNSNTLLAVPCRTNQPTTSQPSQPAGQSVPSFRPRVRPSVSQCTHFAVVCAGGWMHVCACVRVCARHDGRGGGGQCTLAAADADSSAQLTKVHARSPSRTHSLATTTNFTSFTSHLPPSLTASLTASLTHHLLRPSVSPLATFSPQDLVFALAVFGICRHACVRMLHTKIIRYQ